MDFIKNIDRKYLIMGGSIIGVIVVLLLSMLLLSSCSTKLSYQKLETKMAKAASKYIEEKGAPEMHQKVIITTEQLVQGKYLKELSKYNSDTCSGTVTVYNNGGNLNYLPYLKCTNYQTVLLKDKIIDDNLVTEKSGLYAMNGEYIFKGENVNNYLKYGSNLFRIMSLDNESIRLVAVNQSEQDIPWDNKFNETTNDRSGENNYEESYIYSYLNSKYGDFSDSYRRKIMPHNICIGSRSSSDASISKSVDCNKILENKYVGLINASDYALASLDKDCSNISNKNCQNYNYLYTALSTTWTLNTISDNTYGAIVYVPGSMAKNPAIESYPYHLVIYVSGNELYKKGDGTYKNPYVIE